MVQYSNVTVTVVHRCVYFVRTATGSRTELYHSYSKKNKMKRYPTIGVRVNHLLDRERRALIFLLRLLVLRRHAVFLAEVWIHSGRAYSHEPHAAAHHALTRCRLCLSEPRRAEPPCLVLSSPATRLALRVVFLDDARDLI